MELPPIESWSIEQDITNLELLSREPGFGAECVTRLIAILRRINREKTATFIPVAPAPAPFTMPTPFPAPTTPPYPYTNPTIICSGGTVNAVEPHADATGTSEAF